MEPIIINVFTFEFTNPELFAVQLTPLFVDINTPPSVPAKSFVSETANARIFKLVNPVFTEAQTPPLLVDKNTPPPYVPANKFAPEVTSA